MTESLKNITVFIIVAQMVIGMRPNKNFEKYLKMIAAMAVLIQIVIPILGIIGNKGKEEFQQILDSFENIQEYEFQTEYDYENIGLPGKYGLWGEENGN